MIKHCHVMRAGKCPRLVALESLIFCESEMLICEIPIITRRHEGTCRILEIEESEKEGWPKCNQHEERKRWILKWI